MFEGVHSLLNWLLKLINLIKLLKFDLSFKSISFIKLV